VSLNEVKTLFGLDVINVNDIRNITTVASRAARLASGATFAGNSIYVQTDLPEVLWLLVTPDINVVPDATLDASWIAVPFSKDTNGSIVVSMQLADVAGVVPAAGTLSQFKDRPSLGNGIVTGGHTSARSTDLPAITFYLAGTAITGFAGKYLASNTTNANNATLTSISIGSNVHTIGNDVLKNCSALTGLVRVPVSVVNISANFLANSGADGVGISLELPAGLVSTYVGLLQNSNVAGPISFPAGTTAIGYDALREAVAASVSFFDKGTLTLPAGLLTVGTRAFSGTATTANVASNTSFFWGTLTLPASLTSIGANAFQNSMFTRVESRRLVAPSIGANALNLAGYIGNGMPAVTDQSIHVLADATGYGTTYGGLTVVYDLPP